jgi:hypothetical protein
VSGLPAHDVRLLARGAELGRIGAFLGQLLGQRESPIRTYRNVLPVRNRPAPWKQGYDLGERARAELVPGARPCRASSSRSSNSASMSHSSPSRPPTSWRRAYSSRELPPWFF